MGVIRAVPMTLRNGETVGGYGGFDMVPGSGLERCYQAFLIRAAESAVTGWVTPDDLTDFIALQVWFSVPEDLLVRFIFGLPDHRDCLEAIKATQMVSLAPTGGGLPIDPESGLYFEGIDVSDLHNFL